jgi:hypothetical protein
MSITITTFIFQAWNLFSYLKECKGLPFQGKDHECILRITYFLENYTGTDDWQYCYIQGTNDLMYVVPSKAEKHVS